jgi:1-acyl-sn-glycerol-3-phosphate acyltransferase
VRFALAQSRSRRLLQRLITANSSGPNFRSAFAWLGILALGLHPIDQHRGREASLRALARAAQASGASILIFPQGTHATTEAELADDPSVRFRAGVAHLAEALDLPVVPFGLAGPEHVIPPSPDEFHGLKIADIPVSVRRGPLVIAFGASLQLQPGETAQSFTARLEEVCFALTREAERSIGRDAGTIDDTGPLVNIA